MTAPLQRPWPPGTYEAAHRGLAIPLVPTGEGTGQEQARQIVTRLRSGARADDILSESGLARVRASIGMPIFASVR